MKTGYLSIETHADHAAMVHILLTDTQPDPEPTTRAARRIRYIARFNDSDAGLMHAQEILKRRLQDPDTRLYSVPLEQAVAALESSDLRHQRMYLDPTLGDDSRAEIAKLIKRHRRWRRRRNAFFRAVGVIAIGLLLLNLLVL